MNYSYLNKIRCYAPRSRKELIEYALVNKLILVAVNAEKILNSSDSIKNLINRNIGYPDGIGAVMAFKKQGIRDVTKIPGCELWLNIIDFHFSDKTFYLVGGNEEVISKTFLNLKSLYPSINIVGFRNGFINTEEDKRELLESISMKKPDIVFVAMGSPRQEFLMEEMYQYRPALYQGLGGSFDVFTGFVKRAPAWWVNNNLEWAYRLIRQPRRLKRQFHLVGFLTRLLFGLL